MYVISSVVDAPLHFIWKTARWRVMKPSHLPSIHKQQTPNCTKGTHSPARPEQTDPDPLPGTQPSIPTRPTSGTVSRAKAVTIRPLDIGKRDNKQKEGGIGRRTVASFSAFHSHYASLRPNLCAKYTYSYFFPIKKKRQQHQLCYVYFHFTESWHQFLFFLFIAVFIGYT